jgi:predicted membrane protein (TIGR00267 family)
VQPGVPLRSTPSFMLPPAARVSDRWEDLLVEAKSFEMKKTTTTRLGRAVRSSLNNSRESPMIGKEKHGTNNSLRDVILGGQDGLVNMLGIALGVVAAGGSTHVLVVTGIAAAITESISMGAVAYTSFGSDRDFYLAEKAREQSEIEATPDDEREEVREIYAAKGFKGQLLEDVVSTITSNRETWISTMMNEELHLQPVEQQSLVRSAVIVTVATLIGHFIPIVPFVVVARTPAIVLAIALSAVTLFAVGVYSAKTLVGDWRKSGLQMVLIGLGAAAVGFLIGRLFHTVGG